MDEQVILNTGLMNANVTWKTTTRLSKACSVRDGWEGHGRNNISVHVFSQCMICRSECCGKIKSKNFFVVHPFGTHTVMSKKLEVLKRMNAWFLS